MRTGARNISNLSCLFLSSSLSLSFCCLFSCCFIELEKTNRSVLIAFLINCKCWWLPKSDNMLAVLALFPCLPLPSPLSLRCPPAPLPSACHVCLDAPLTSGCTQINGQDLDALLPLSLSPHWEWDCGAVFGLTLGASKMTHYK